MELVFSVSSQSDEVLKLSMKMSLRHMRRTGWFYATIIPWFIYIIPSRVLTL